MNDGTLRGRLVLACLLAVTLLAGFASGYMLWNLVLPYPMHAREYIEPSLVQLLLADKNPYAIEQNPTYLYPYGIFYHLMVYPLAAVFGPSLVVLRAFSDAGIFLACGVFYWGMRLTRVPPVIAWIGVLLFYVHLAYNEPCCGPNPWGVFFMLLGLVLPLARDFRWGSIVANLVLALVAFFTKHYCILCAPVLLLYLFLYRSKCAGLAAGVLFFSLLAGFLWLLSSLFPLFLTNVIYHSYNYTAAFTSYGHLLRVMAMYFPMGIALVVLWGWWSWGIFAGPQSPLKTAWKFNLTDLRQPLILQPVLPWTDYLLITYGLLYLIKMGPHAGNALSYVFELVTPFLIWRCCVIAGVEAARRVLPVLCLLAAVLMVGAFYVVPMVRLTQTDHRPEWNRVAQAVAGYQNMLAPAGLNGILEAHGERVYDGGITDLYTYCFPRNPLAIAAVYHRHCDDFFASLQQDVREHKFDAIVLYAQPCVITPLVPRDLVAQYYRKLDTLPLPMAVESYRVEIWVPR